jgi:hypothetical protein
LVVRVPEDDEERKGADFDEVEAYDDARGEAREEVLDELAEDLNR